MAEVGEPGGARTNSKQLFVPVRSVDRAHLITPSSDAPGLFEFDVGPSTIPVEDRVVGMMRTHHGILVSPDCTLEAPKGESMVLGQSVFLRYVVDYGLSAGHGTFTPREVNERRRELVELSRDESLDPEVQRQHRLRAHMFGQVLNLFSGNRR